MKPLHSSTWRTESDCGVQVDVAEGRTTEWAPFREIVVTTDAGMTPAEARRLIVDLQHAVALAEEFDAPEREDVSTEDQPKPREETCGAGVEWDDGRRVCELNEGHDGRHQNDDLLWWSDDREQPAASGDQPKPRSPRVFPKGSFEPEGVEAVTDEDGFRWIRAGRATRIQHYWRRAGLGVMGNLVLWTRLNRRPLTEVLADAEQVRHG